MLELGIESGSVDKYNQNLSPVAKCQKYGGKEGRANGGVGWARSPATEVKVNESGGFGAI